MVDGEHGQHGDDDGDRGGDCAIEDCLVARQPAQPAKKLIHWRGDAAAPPPAPHSPFAASRPHAWSRSTRLAGNVFIASA